VIPSPQFPPLPLPILADSSSVTGRETGSRDGPRGISCSGSGLAGSGVSPPLRPQRAIENACPLTFTPAFTLIRLLTHTHTHTHISVHPFLCLSRTFCPIYTVPVLVALDASGSSSGLSPPPPIPIPSSERQLFVIEDEVALWPFPCSLAHQSSHPLVAACAGNEGLEGECPLVLENSLPVNRHSSEGWG